MCVCVCVCVKLCCCSVATVMWPEKLHIIIHIFFRVTGKRTGNRNSVAYQRVVFIRRGADKSLARPTS